MVLQLLQKTLKFRGTTERKQIIFQDGFEMWIFLIDVADF